MFWCLVLSLILLPLAKTQNCNDKFHFESCNGTSKTRTVFSQSSDATIKTQFQSDCPNQKLEYKWWRNGEKLDDVSRALTLPKNSLEPGNYNISAEVTIIGQSKNRVLRDECFLRIKKPGPEAVIEGGIERSVDPGYSFVMDGSKSIDIDMVPNESKQLMYSWSCEVVRGKPQSFCNQKFTSSLFSVPAEFAVKNTVYKFTLQIKTQGDWLDSATQMVTVELRVELSIRCQRNCEPKANVQESVSFRVSCTGSCQQVPNNSYLWSIKEDESFDYAKSTSGRTSTEFVIKENVLTPDTTYMVQVKLTSGLDARAEYSIRTFVPLKIQSCMVKPPSGTAMDTRFTLACNYTGVPTKFRVYTEKEGNQESVATNKTLEALSFYLPAYTKVYLQIIDEEKNSDAYQLNVKVVKSGEPVETKIKIVCVDNCDPSADPRFTTTLQVECVYTCDFNKGVSFIWSVFGSPEFRYEDFTTTGRYSRTFTVKEKVFSSGTQYPVYVEMSGALYGNANFPLDAYTELQIEECEVKPKEGESLETKFKVSCKYEGKATSFEIYTKSNGMRKTISKGRALELLEFMLAFGDTAYIEMMDAEGAKASLLLDVDVLPPVNKPIKINECKAIPPEGIAIETTFNFECNYTGVGTSFEVFTMKQNTSKVTLSTTNKLESLGVLLPTGVDAFIKIVDQYDTSDVYKLNVQVKSPSGEDMAAKITRHTGTVKSLIHANSISKAVQVANGILEELTTESGVDVQETKRQLLRAFVEAPVDSREGAREIYHFVTRMVHDPNAESDPYQAALATKACKKGAHVDFRHLHHKFYPHRIAHEIRHNARVLMKCGSTDTKPNYRHLKKKRLQISVSTPFPLLTVAVIGEDYSDYDADDTVAEKVKKYEEASENYVDICRTSLQMMALTVVEGEDSIVKTTDNVSVRVTRLVGNKLVEKDIDIHGAAFRASKDLRVVDPIDVLMCSWHKDIFWWNLQKRNVSTNVVLIKVSRKKDQLVHFKEPNLVVLDIHQDRDLDIEFYEFEDENISVVRIDVKSNESFFVEFACNDTEEFRVLITEFDKPDVNEVQAFGVVVNQNRSILYQEHNHDYDAWYYVSVTPRWKRTTSFRYNISVYTKSCYAWNGTNKHWEFACKGIANTTSLKIYCTCNHLSILAGLIYNNNLKLDKIFAFLDFGYFLNMSLVIFVTTALTFALYCILLATIIRKKLANSMNLYLPPDISSTARYVYLIGIRTGRKPRSGTSANVCVKLFGSKRNSQSHVLNYPDPQKRIFQWGSEDWFVVPTEKHLGHKLEMALWTDVSGRHPRWYCSNVTIYDLQLFTKWYFDVSTWFDMPPHGQVYVKVEGNAEQKTQKREKLLATVLLRIIPRRLHQASFSDLTKFTLLESTFGTLGVFVLVMYGVPSLNQSDNFATIHEYGLHPQVFEYGIIGSVITFVIHMGLQWVLKNSGTNERFPVEAARICQWFLYFNIVLSLTILVIFGFWVPTVIAWLWFTSVLLGLLIYVLVLENVYEIVTTFNYKPKEDFKFINNVDVVLRSVSKQRKHLFKIFGETLLRPYCAHLYKPLDVPEMKVRALYFESRFKVVALLEDTIMFICYITLLYLAIFAQKNNMSVINYKEIEALMIGEHTRTEFSITSIFQFYEYVNTTLIPVLHANHWYSKYVVQDPGLMLDFANKFLGVARMRQQRIQRAPCPLPPQYDFLKSNSCRPEAEHAKSNSTYFGPKFNDLVRLKLIWNYTKADRSGYSIVVGRFGVYHGGGFVAPLGRTLYNSYVNVNYLWKNRWIDGATSVVFVEFLAYNVNTNLFNAVRLMVEKSASGYFLTQLRINTVRLLFVKHEDNTAELVIFGSFGVVVLLFTVRVVRRLWKGRLLVWKDLWTLVDLVIVMMSYTCVGLFLHRAEMVRLFLNEMESAKKNDLINYFHMIHEDLLFTLIAALLVFVSTVRLWKACRIGRVFRIMENTLIMSMVPILIILLFNLIIVLTFSLFGCMHFGNMSQDFQDVAESLVSLMRLATHLIGYFNLRALLNSSPILANLFFTTYMLANLFLYNMYVATIISYYHQAQRLESGLQEYTTLKRFLIKEIKFYRTSVRMGVARLKAGAKKPKKQFVTPKGDEFRYENCITLPRTILELMRCIAYYDLMRYKLRGKQKFEVMEQVVACLRHGNDIDIFFPEKIRHNVIKIVFDGKVVNVAAAVELILGYHDIFQRKQRLEQRYRRIVDLQLNRLDYVNEVLKTAWKIISHIDIQ